MKKPLLILFTNYFPCGKKETFLEVEVDYLREFFQIVIIPWQLYQIDIQEDCRSVPGDVLVRTDIAERLSWRLRDIIVWIASHPRTLQEILFVIMASRKEFIQTKNLVYWWQLLRFLVRSVQLARLTEDTLSDNADIVYSYWLTSSAMAGALMKRSGTAAVVVSRVHSIDLYHYRSPLGFVCGQLTTLNFLDKVFCISAHGANYLRQRYPQHASKIELNRLGVRPASLLNPGSQGGVLRLVSCAHLSSVKRIELLVEALAQCKIPITWTHLGGGELEEKIRRLASTLPGNIQWQVTGILRNQDVLQFYRENPVDLFINVSVVEGLPVAIMEAMSYGIPVAATDVGGVSELVRLGENGYLWPADIGPDAIVATLQQFYSLSDARKNAMRKKAWQAWHDRVNADIQYPDFARRLLEMIPTENPTSSISESA